jgi:hypothetical protein
LQPFDTWGGKRDNFSQKTKPSHPLWKKRPEKGRARGISMRSFKKELTKEMRWNLVNYIRSMEGQRKD